jgi:predicted ribosomally synthesized peptide with nif11-like leader
MSLTDAEAFIARAETDEAFAKELESLAPNPDAVFAKVHEAGYDVTQDEIKEAFLERYGAELTPEQMDAIAAGLTSEAEIGIGVTGGLLAALGIGGAVAAAAVS